MDNIALTQNEIMILIVVVAVLGMVVSLALVSIGKSTDLSDTDKRKRILFIAGAEALALVTTLFALLFTNV